MKLKLFILLAVAGFVGDAQVLDYRDRANNYDRARFYFGVKTGANLTVFNVDKINYKAEYTDDKGMPVTSEGYVSLSFNPVASAFISLMSDFRVNKWFSMELEVAYSAISAEGNLKDELANSFETRHQILFQGVYSPFTLKFYPYRKLPLTIGAYGAYYFRQSVWDSVEGAENHKTSNYFRPYDTGLLAGISYVFDVGAFFDLRYRYSIINPIEDHSSLLENIGGQIVTLDLRRGHSTAKRYYISFGFGYMF